MGIGEAVADALAVPDAALRVRDLAAPSIVAGTLAAGRERTRVALRNALSQLRETGVSGASDELATYDDLKLIGRYVDCAQAYAARVTLGDEDWLRVRMQAGVTVFEPAQGTLIDEDYGFHPHTTWSHTTLANAEALLRATGFAGETVRVGLVRAYSTRHGAGPFVPEDAAMAAWLPDPYNQAGDWQGAMRCGPLDFVATRYALAVNPGVDWLAVSHLDCLDLLPGYSGHWPFCRRYAHAGSPQDALAAYDAAGQIANLRPAPRPDLAYQARLTALLMHCAPVVEQIDAQHLLDLVAQETGRPVGLCAWGPTAAERAFTRRRPAVGGAAARPPSSRWRRSLLRHQDAGGAQPVQLLVGEAKVVPPLVPQERQRQLLGDLEAQVQ
jgi:adenylosuccinate synthase